MTVEAVVRGPAVQGDAPRRAWVRQLMGMPWSIHVRGASAHDPATAERVEAAFADVAHVEAVLSPFRHDSALSRLRRGELTLQSGPEELRAVETLCHVARERTDGMFDAWAWRDGFDPTGLVKGWAISRAVEVLRAVPDDVLVNAGGDVAVLSRSGEPWRIGIEDPRRPGEVLGWVDQGTGAVATSGPAARGPHVRDPRTGDAATGVQSATVVADSILWADVWATTAVVLGRALPAVAAGWAGTSGLVLFDDGTVHRWATPA